MQIYTLQTSTDDGADINADVDEWEADFPDLLEGEVDSYASVVNVKYPTSRSIDDALGESVGGEIPLFIATCECV